MSICVAFANSAKIAELVNEYFELDQEETSPRKTKHSAFVQGDVPLAEVNHVADEHTGADEDDRRASSSTSNSNGSHQRSLPKAELRALKKAVKHEKSTKKSFKSQEKRRISLRQEDVDRVAEALHGDSADISSGSGHPLATDKNLEDVIERNRRFVANIEEHTVYLCKMVRTQRRAAISQRKSRERFSVEASGDLPSEEDVEEVANGVMAELGIVLPSATCRRYSSDESFSLPKLAERTAILQKLRTAIREDLAKHENEQRQTCIRAGGFWRYCGRPVFERMTEVAKEIDWRTGEKIRPGKRVSAGEAEPLDNED